MYFNNPLRKRGLKLYKKIFRIFVDSFYVFFIVRVFIVIKYSTTANQLYYYEMHYYERPNESNGPLFYSFFDQVLSEQC